MLRVKKREAERYGEKLFTDPEIQKMHNDFIAFCKDYDEMKGIANRTIKATVNGWRIRLLKLLKFREIFRL